LTIPQFRTSKTEASLSLAKKKIVIAAKEATVMMSLTNEYGNSVSYSMDGNQFDGLFSELWRFVKESQH
jgi:hypothetical protein